VKLAYVYILSNRSKSFYTGITTNLEKRVWEHKQGIASDFTRRYKIDRLVYFERWTTIVFAIAREKQIKGMTRLKKTALIVSMNPEWKDLSHEWFKDGSPYKPPAKSIDPSLRFRLRSG
jgi:putative endonuclease